MLMTKIKTLKIWNEDKTKRVPIAPRTHVKAVFDDQGNTLDSLLEVQNEKLSELGSEVSVLNRKTNSFYENFSILGIRLLEDNTFTSDKSESLLIPVSEGDLLTVSRATNGNSSFAFLKSENNLTEGSTPEFSEYITGRQIVKSSEANKTYIVPIDVRFIIVTLKAFGSYEWRPTTLEINRVDVYGSLTSVVLANSSNINKVLRSIKKTDLFTLSIENGSFDVKDGFEVDNNLRARTSQYLTAPFELATNENYKILSVFKYDIENLSYVSYDYVNKTSLEVTDNNYLYRIIFKHVDDENISGNKKEIISRFKPSFLYRIEAEIESESQENNMFRLPITMFENGDIDTNGHMMAVKDEYKFFCNLRTKRFLKCSRLTYIPQDDLLVKVFEYDQNLTYIRDIEVNGDYTKSSDAYAIKIVIKGTSVDVQNFPLQQGGIDTSGVDIKSNYRVRTDYIPIEDFDNVWFRNHVYVRIYDENKSLIAYIPKRLGPIYVKNDILYSYGNSVKYLRFSFAFSDTEKITPENANVIFTSSSENISVPSFFVDKFEEINNVYIDENVMEFIYSVYTPSSFNTESSDDVLQQYNERRYINTCKMLLPSSYSVYGEPTKVIIMCHGSDDYGELWNNKMTENYNDYYGYWVKEGYAVVDFYANSSKYSTRNNESQGTPTSVSVIEQGWEWLCEHYNIDKTGCYVSCKSLGGLAALSILYSSIPVKACDMLAPLLNPNTRQFGWSKVGKSIYIEDCNLQGCESLIQAEGTGAVLDREVFNDIIRLNIDKLAGWNAYYANITNITFKDLIDMSYNKIGDYDNVIKMCKAPVRIHIAKDDNAVSYGASFNLIKSLQNGGCKAEIRTMPSGTGGHHSVDNDSNALKVDKITTRLGYECLDIPLAYVECVSWFRQFE